MCVKTDLDPLSFPFLQAMATSENPLLQDKDERDPTLFCTAWKRPRFYMFTREEPECVSLLSFPFSSFLSFLYSFSSPLSLIAVPSFASFLFLTMLTTLIPHLCRDKTGERDVYNEKPTRDEMSVAAPAAVASGPLPRKATIHTTLGDIKVELYGDMVPKTVENFVGLSKKHYYDEVIFHRVIPKFVCFSSLFFPILVR
jgi:peptidylprolyl isomerase domain and WD repeat-containing protein 1